MKHTFINNYLFGEDLKINLLGLKKECREIEALIIKNAKPIDAPNNIHYNLKTTSLYSQYNVFTYSGSTIQSLYKKIKQSVMPFLSDRNDYMIQGWLNIYNKNQSIGWHRHYPAVAKTWHGFFCVSTEDTPSFTNYKIYPAETEYKVISRDNLLVFGKSENDFHCTSVWTSENPRITIAFDIIPIKYLYSSPRDRILNHFLPF